MSEILLHNLREQLLILPANLAGHLQITVIALAGGVLISLPLGILVARRPMLRYPTMTIVSVIQTIPSLALLALMVPVLVGIGALTSALAGVEISALGFWPAVIALTLYSMLPIVRNTVTGITGVDPAVTEAARGVGMYPRQVLWKVQLPLAAPIILAGIRTATVWVVGIATLSTPVGQRSLGNFIFRGLQLRDWMMVAFGCVAAALLAIMLDMLIGAIERGVAQRRRGLVTGSAVALAVVLMGGLSAPMMVRAWQTGGAGRPTAASVDAGRITRPIRIGAKTFTEQYILAAVIEQTLGARGYDARHRESLGSTVVFDALANGQIDVYVDYSGTIWANYMNNAGSASPEVVIDEMTWWLAREHGIRCLGALGFENAYALAMRRAQADQFGIEAVGDLADYAPDWTIGGDYEFFGRPEWQAIRREYELRFSGQTSYDSAFMYTSLMQDEAQVIAAFSSDGRIAAFDLVTLADPLQVVPPYDAVLLVSSEAAEDPALVAALRELVGRIPVDLMRQANYMVDRNEDKRTVRQAARWLIEQIN